MPRLTPPALSRRERQILDVVYRLGSASAADVHAALPDAPTYTTVRGLLRVLEEKGHLTHEERGRQYVYLASTPREDAGASHLAHVVRTFFGGSPTDAMAALLGSTDRVSADDLERIARLIDDAQRRQRARGKSPRP